MCLKIELANEVKKEATSSCPGAIERPSWKKQRHQSGRKTGNRLVYKVRKEGSAHHRIQKRFVAISELLFLVGIVKLLNGNSDIPCCLLPDMLGVSISTFSEHSGDC